MWDELRAQERYKNLLREVEHDRLVAKVRSPQPGLYAHLMIRVADLLVRIGNRLQARYRLHHEEAIIVHEYGSHQCQDC